MLSRGSTLVNYEVFYPRDLFLGHLKLLYDLLTQGLERSFLIFRKIKDFITICYLYWLSTKSDELWVCSRSIVLYISSWKSSTIFKSQSIQSSSRAQQEQAICQTDCRLPSPPDVVQLLGCNNRWPLVNGMHLSSRICTKWVPTYHWISWKWFINSLFTKLVEERSSKGREH
jgi:hypothetical protein